jgi:hypothetical protein
MNKYMKIKKEERKKERKVSFRSLGYGNKTHE